MGAPIVCADVADPVDRWRVGFEIEDRRTLLGVDERDVDRALGGVDPKNRHRCQTDRVRSHGGASGEDAELLRSFRVRPIAREKTTALFRVNEMAPEEDDNVAESGQPFEGLPERLIDLETGRAVGDLDVADRSKLES